MFSPARANSRLVAAPKPLDEPIINPQGVGRVSVIFFSEAEEWTIADCRLPVERKTKFENRKWKLETRNWKLENRKSKMEI
jgi:hypothetical protein